MSIPDDFLAGLSHINFETALLESLGWDESELTRLQDYLRSATLKGQSYTDTLSEIESEFGLPAADMLRKLFGEMIFKYNLHTKGQEIEN